ncbi:competence type IV pilus minor pilin ComGF [Salirhabdus sp. Marseille-P4669]|uniref:competence type IV pilus minor pilin ComGF n=1 Tax=Salirhabdus sp. Marseille-P4669 TaxID=2042310 RepID=UPI000C7ABDD4
MSLNEGKNGYTFITILFSLSIFIMITPFLSSLIQLFISMNDSKTEDYSIANFFYLLQYELNQSNGVQLTTSGLLLHQNDQMITIERYTNQIRRRVNYAGHEVMLFNVQSIKWEDEKHTLYVTIKIQGGETYERRLFKGATFQE